MHKNRLNLTIISFCLTLFLVACGSNTSEDHGSGNVIKGKKIFEQYCILCHGDNGKMQLNGAKDITVSQLTFDLRMILIKDGKNLMTPFDGILSDSEIEDVASYSMTLKQ